MPNVMRVLVFGTTGSGKTSLCNTLTGEKRPVSNSARGVTFQSYTYNPFDLDGTTCILTDTVGLNESDRGTVPSKEALKELVSLLRNSKEGYSLLIHVMRIPRITKSEHDNYQFFVKTIAESRIPTVLVATGCENVEPMSQWASDNAAAFQREGLLYKDIISACFAEGGRLEAVYADLRQESCKAVSQAITAYSASQPIKIYETSQGILPTLRRAWNWFCQWAGWDQLMFTVNEALRILLIRLGFPEEEATKLSGEWDKK